MTSRADVRLFFDFVSPYAFLALHQLPALAASHRIRFLVRPVVYGALLDATGLVGPVEVPAKRRYTFADVQRAAALAGVPLAGPPAHPFRSLEALRAVCLQSSEQDRLRLSSALAREAWSHGADLTDPGAIARVLASLEMPATDLTQRLAAPETKERLAAFTREALQAGVFGVPTFELAGELFWGHDRIGHLLARIQGRIPEPDVALRELLKRPSAAARRKAPSSGLR